MNTSIGAITVNEVATLCRKGLISSRYSDLAFHLEEVKGVLDILQAASKPMRCMEITGMRHANDPTTGEFSRQFYSAILRKLVDARVVKRVDLGDEIITLPSGRKVVSMIVGFELNR